LSPATSPKAENQFIGALRDTDPDAKVVDNAYLSFWPMELKHPKLAIA
jgi:hypothetical protein